VFRTGDDVVHAQLGEGVVLGTEPGGIVVVRFAEDGRERKLMADFAPTRRRCGLQLRACKAAGSTRRAGRVAPLFP
jgi:hypothetical protein